MRNTNYLYYQSLSFAATLRLSGTALRKALKAGTIRNIIVMSSTWEIMVAGMTLDWPSESFLVFPAEAPETGRNERDRWLISTIRRDLQLQTETDV